MADAQTLLTEIPKLVAAHDAAALVSHQDHPDKAVRKAVRKALHGLRSKGVAIPEASRSWSTGDLLQQLRGDVEPLARLDAKSRPGLTEFVLSLPRDREGAVLIVAHLAADDTVLGSMVREQTDGQRGRMRRDWERDDNPLLVPVDWAKARIRWARERTVQRGQSVADELDQTLSLLGEAPATRPSVPFVESLKGGSPPVGDAIESVLVDGTMLNVSSWPTMVNLEPMLEAAAKIHGDKPQPEKEEDRMALLGQAIEGNDAIREELRSTLPCAIEDVAAHMWLRKREQDAQTFYAMAEALRSSDTPEKLAFVPRLLGYQVASLLREMGGPEAVMRAQAQAQAAGSK